MLGNQGGRMLDVKTQVDPLATGISVLSNGVKPCVCCIFCQVFARGSLGFSYSPLKRKRNYAETYDKTSCKCKVVMSP